MACQKANDRFSQIHIDVARNATDDFNLFHDSLKWSRIVQNPFLGPIVLGFQIESFIEHKINRYRQNHQEAELITQNNLNFSNYQFSFANAVKPEQPVDVDIKKTRISTADEYSLSNRVCFKANNKVAVIGFKKETQSPLFLSSPELSTISSNLINYPDRSFLDKQQGSFFLKRKFMNTSNAKNFLCGSLIDQRLYFDELEGKYQFPEIFPCAFISCALLEKSMLEKLNFETSPMVYSSHKISIDRLLLSQLESNDVLHILIRLQKNGNDIKSIQSYECYGLIANNKILFRAIVELMPLESIVNTIND